jgi:hypothetical protein
MLSIDLHISKGPNEDFWSALDQMLQSAQIRHFRMDFFKLTASANKIFQTFMSTALLTELSLHSDLMSKPLNVLSSFWNDIVS